MEKRIERFCEHINADVKIKIVVGTEKMLGGYLYTTTNPSRNVCSENKKCNRKNCDIINQEVENEMSRLKENNIKEQEEKKKWNF